ncbi:MAG: class I SAM-dependent methyltransferase [Agriterribacter sp.]
MENHSWNQHYNEVSKKALAPAATLNFALKQFNSEQLALEKKVAIDLGFGNGIDSLAVLADGWQLTAIDKESAAIEHLNQLVSDEDANRLNIIHQSFEEVALHPAMLINATFSLPFCTPQHFPLLWKNILIALQPGGRFAGHFFGVEDSWADREDMTFHTLALLQELFTGFSIEQFEETKRDGKTISGTAKRWHVYHVVAQYR